MDRFLENLSLKQLWLGADLALAALLGFFIGLERKLRDKEAGIRTHTVVSFGAALMMLISKFAFDAEADSARVAAQIVAGIGFLGVGTIMVRDRSRVTGLTTAAGLWATASIGLAIGIGFYFAALMAFLAIFFTITVLIFLEKRVKRKNPYLCYVECMNIGTVKGLYHEIKPYASQIEIIPAKSGIPSHIGFEFQADSRLEYEALLKKAEENANVVIALPIQN